MKYSVGFAVAGSVMTILFLGIVNMLTSPNHLWFIYPCLFLIFWPASVYFHYKKQYVQYAMFGSAVLIVFFIVENLLHSPSHLWSFYVIYPILWWPISAILGNRMGTLSVAVIGAIATILYYGLLNIIMSPVHPWFIYPSFAVLWWPLSIYHYHREKKDGRRKNAFYFSVHATILISVFFITVNLVSSPHTIWAIYPIFGVLWWPLSMYFYVYRKVN